MGVKRFANRVYADSQMCIHDEDEQNENENAHRCNHQHYQQCSRIIISSELLEALAGFNVDIFFFFFKNV